MKKIILLLLILSHIVCNAQKHATVSYYGGKFHGRKTASGEIFNKHEMTCAHKTLPFNEYVEMTSVRTGKKIIVRVNDRGPFIKGREFDLSEKAAKELGIDGIGKVVWKIVKKPNTEIKIPFKPLKIDYNVEIKYPFLPNGKYEIYVFKDSLCPFLPNGKYEIYDL